MTPDVTIAEMRLNASSSTASDTAKLIRTQLGQWATTVFQQKGPMPINEHITAGGPTGEVELVGMRSSNLLVQCCGD